MYIVKIEKTFENIYIVKIEKTSENCTQGTKHIRKPDTLAI